MKIYTKTGDEGTTGLIGGARIAKASLRMTAIGDVDELNAAIGLARAASDAMDAVLGPTQSWLFDLGGELASPNEHARMHRVSWASQIETLERSIDALTANLEPLRHFILPGGSEFAARLHFARCVCRRAERSILALHEHEPVNAEPRVFVNRLSDWLFTAARTANQTAGVQDVKWEPSGD